MLYLLIYHPILMAAAVFPAGLILCMYLLKRERSRS